MMRSLFIVTATCVLACGSTTNAITTENVTDPGSPQASADIRKGWLSWRGPNQDGVSPETGLIDSLSVDGENHLWSYEIAGRGTPVVSAGRVFGLGYEGEGRELEAVVFCLDEVSGELIWEHRSSDFLSDVIYSRYAIGSPTVDPATGNVFTMTAAGLLRCFTRDGELLWERSMGEDLGRLTFPNGRTGAPLIYGDQVIIHFIFAAWGPLGPARDRFHSFDKTTGAVLWASTPGGPPKDSTFGLPVVEERDGHALLYAGLGGGFAACVDARTGKPRWKYPMAVGGVNSSMLLYGDNLIAIHGRENVDSSTIGRMVSLRLDGAIDDNGVLSNDAETWRADLVAFTSSPVLVGNRVYATVQTGDLVCVDADTGKALWHEKLAPDQLHASPIAADGKLYVPMTNGNFHIIRPSDEGMELLDSDQLGGSSLGAPAIANGRIYVHTTERLYCFGKPTDGAPVWPDLPGANAVGKAPAVALQLVPADATFHMSAAEDLSYEVRALDDRGRLVEVLDNSSVELTKPGWIAAGKPAVGVVKAKSGALTGAARVRGVPDIPSLQDFSGIELNQKGETPWAWPPGFWLGGRMKWKVVEHEGESLISRRLDNPLFQRTVSLFGRPDDSNYTVSADMMSDGNRRSMCSVGVVNQRYLIVLKGNHQEIEVSSNMERLKVGSPFKWKVGLWYSMKTRVDLAGDGSGIVRAKVWLRGTDEPDAWTIEVTDPHAQSHGAAGVYAFTPQSRFTAYLDNITVTPND
ncbi:MAG: outer membrane protein assembly factor BamB [Planctomycetota bacterium]|jgi:outer membrane protein assembly factor BamB